MEISRPRDLRKMLLLLLLLWQVDPCGNFSDTSSLEFPKTSTVKSTRISSAFFPSSSFFSLLFRLFLLKNQKEKTEKKFKKKRRKKKKLSSCAFNLETALNNF